MTVTTLTSMSDYRKHIALADGVAVVDAYATWCQPCKTLAPVLDQMAAETPQAQFYKFDVEQVPELGQELGISAMPTVTVFKDGDVVDKIRGVNVSGIKGAVEKALAAK